MRMHFSGSSFLQSDDKQRYLNCASREVLNFPLSRS